MPRSKKGNEHEPLLDFIKNEVPFRLKEILGFPEEKITGELINSCVKELYDNSDVMFDYDAIDSLLIGVCDGGEKEEITTVCYGEEQKWKSRQEAIDFYINAMASSEGSERERYTEILLQLDSGLTYCTDEVK